MYACFYNTFYSSERLARYDKLGGHRRKENSRIVSETLYRNCTTVTLKYILHIVVTDYLQTEDPTVVSDHSWYQDFKELSPKKAMLWVKENLSEDAAERIMSEFKPRDEEWMRNYK